MDWDIFFGTLERLGFDGIVTACVSAWEERAYDSSVLMRERIVQYTSQWGHAASQRP